MADQVGKSNVNNIQFLKNAVCAKEEEYQNADFVDDKVYISETAITIDNPELQDLSLPHKMYSISTILDNIKVEFPPSEVQHNMIQDNLKIEEEIDADNIKIEFNNGLLYCEDCHVYYEDYCANCGMLVHILNKTVPVNGVNRLQEKLPNNDVLEIRNYCEEYRIFALKSIPADVRFGPFLGLDKTEHSWKIKGGKFVVNKDKSMHLNWMQYINRAKNVSEQNLQVFQYEHSLYYKSTRQIEEGDELLVYFGEEYEDSLNGNVEMDLIPTVERIFNDAFACTFCCLGFSSKSYLAKHKTICKANGGEGFFSIEELTQCPYCKIHLEQKEYIKHHMDYCCKINDRERVLPAADNQTTQTNRPKTRPRPVYKCQLCKYKTKYKVELENHINQHYTVKMYKCGICCSRFKAEEVLRQHVENTHDWPGGKGDSKRAIGVYMQAERSYSQDEKKQIKYSSCERRTKNIGKHSQRCSYKCDICDYKTNSKSCLKEFKYNCDTCDYKANQKRYLETHIRTKHLREFKYKCDRCDYKANRKLCFRIHIQTKHLKEFKYKCDTCDYKTNRKSCLRIHTETKHLKEFKYNCDTCDYKANQKQYLEAHMRRKHLKELKYKYDTCDYKAGHKYHLTKRIEARRLEEFKFKCDACEYKANRKCQLMSHIKTKHLKEFKYKCGTCDYKTNNKYCLRRHTQARHLNERKHKCGSCDYKANTKHKLKSHTEAKHLKRLKYQCGICDHRTNFKSNLKKHIDVKHRHLIGHSYECEICDYKTNWKVCLENHIAARHLEEFKYKCDMCDHKTNWKSELKRHIEAIHLKVFKYKCEICDYKTNWKVCLENHIGARHLEEFKYKCDMCDHKTNWKSELKRHIEAIHLKVFKYKCDICDYKTNWKSCLEHHMAARHLKNLNKV